MLQVGKLRLRESDLPRSELASAADKFQTQSCMAAAILVLSTAPWYSYSA